MTPYELLSDVHCLRLVETWLRWTRSGVVLLAVLLTSALLASLPARCWAHQREATSNASSDKTAGGQQKDDGEPRPEDESPVPENAEPAETPFLDRRVTLSTNQSSFQQVLGNLGKLAGVRVELDIDGLKAASVAADAPVSIDVNDVRLEEALQTVIAALQDVVRGQVYFKVLDGRVLVSNWGVLRKLEDERLPEWLRALKGQGVSARLDDEGQVGSLSVSSADALMKLEELPNLKKLHLSSLGRISGEAMQRTAAFAALETLEFYSVNMPDDTLVHLQQLKSLRELSFNEGQVSDAGIEHLKGMQQLRTLRLGGNRLTDAAMAHLTRLKHLEVLEIADTNWVESNMRITDEGLKPISTLNRLRGLDLGGLQISDDGLASLSGLRELRRLNLRGTQVTGTGLRHLANFPELESLRLGGTRITDDGMEHVAGCTKLRQLSLGYTRVGDEGFRHLAKLEQLKSLHVDSRYVTDRGMANIAGLRQLTHLELRASQVGDESLRHISKIKSLTYLSLSGGGRPGVQVGRSFTGVGYAHLATLPKLASLHLVNADVRWTELRSLKQLKSLDMLMPTMSQNDVRELQKALPDTYVSAAWGGSSVPPIQLVPD